MQVGCRGLLAVALAIGAAACTVNENGLGSTDAGSVVLAGAAGSQGLAGTGPSPTGAAGMPMSSGAAGTGSTGTAGVTGAAGDGQAGTGGDPPTGAAGDITGLAGTNGGAGVTGAAGAAGTTAPTGQAGMTGGAGAGGAGAAGSAGAAGVTGAAGAAGTGAAGAAGTGATAGAGGSAAGGKGGSGAAGATGTPGEIGCSDGSREGYLDRVKYPRIAACEGGWEEPGLYSLDARTPQCDRRGGNDGDRADGRDCSITDLCASGWAVCDTAKTVSTAAPGGCADAIAPYGDSKPVFFLTRQRGTGLVCDANNQTGTNNLYGCGNIGSAPDKSCAPFTRMLRDSDCQNNWPWVCAEGPISTSQNEYNVVTKDGPSKGGVLCCKN